jgi:hypothetical protein
MTVGANWRELPLQVGIHFHIGMKHRQPDHATDRVLLTRKREIPFYNCQTEKRAGPSQLAVAHSWATPSLQMAYSFLICHVYISLKVVLQIRVQSL